MNIDIMLAMLNQAANLISLVGSYLAQTSAEISAEIASQNTPYPFMEEAAIDYNVLGNQLTTIGLAIYTIAGQIDLNLIIAEANMSTSSNEDSQNDEEGTASETDRSDEAADNLRVWHIERIKRLRRRRWRTIKHLS